MYFSGLDIIEEIMGQESDEYEEELVSMSKELFDEWLSIVVSVSKKIFDGWLSNVSIFSLLLSNTCYTDG